MERSAARSLYNILQHSVHHVATDIRWRIGYKACFEKLVVQQDFSLRTYGLPVQEDDPRAEKFHLLRKYGEMLAPDASASLVCNRSAQLIGDNNNGSLRCLISSQASATCGEHAGLETHCESLEWPF